MEQRIKKVKDWIDKKPQFKYVLAANAFTTSAQRIKDGKIFQLNDSIISVRGSGNIVVFQPDLIHVVIATSPGIIIVEPIDNLLKIAIVEEKGYSIDYGNWDLK